MQIRLLKPHQMKHLTTQCHLKTTIHSFTEPQHTAAIGKAMEKEKSMPEVAMKGIHQGTKMSVSNLDCLCPVS